MFTEDVTLGIMPLGRHDSKPYEASIKGTEAETARAVTLLRSLERHEGYDVKELVANAIRTVAENLAWFGRAPYEISHSIDDPSVYFLNGFTSRRLFVLPGSYVQLVPRADRELWKKSIVVLPREQVWLIDMPQILGGYWGYRALLLRLRGVQDIAPPFWLRDLQNQQPLSSFSFTEYRREVDVFTFRITRHWGWNRRDTSDNNCTEFALFYRTITMRWAQAVLREHILNEINALLQRLGIRAQIHVSKLPTADEIIGLRNDMIYGNLSYSKVYDVTTV